MNPRYDDPRIDKLHDVLNDPRFQYGTKTRPRDLSDVIADYARAVFKWYSELEPVSRALGTSALLGLFAALIASLATRGSDLSPRARRAWVAGSGSAVFIVAVIFFIIWGKDGPSINVIGLGPLGLVLMALAVGGLVTGVAVLTARTIAPAPVSLATTAEERSLNSAQSSRRAIEQAAAGNYRDAIRYLYLTTLILLDERNLLRFDHSLTNREYLLTLGQSKLGNLLRPIVDTFDQTWYGHTDPSREEYDRYSGLVEQVRQVQV